MHHIVKQKGKFYYIKSVRFASNLNKTSVTHTVDVQNVNQEDKADASGEEIVPELHRKNDTKTKKIFEVNSTKDKVRFNHFNIQMITKQMCEHLFGSWNTEPDMVLIEKAVNELNAFHLLKKQDEVSDVKLNLPKLEGNTIEDHFYNIGKSQCSPYRLLLEDLIKNKLPKKPDKWTIQPGWTRYIGDCADSVDYPKENAFVFDVEVCCKEGLLPTMATAVSSEAWYSWTSSDLINGSKNTGGRKHYLTENLIPFESGPKERGYKLDEKYKISKIVVGHHVAYDRARIKEQYWLERTALRFMDTMSLHVCISGVTSYQKALLKSGVTDDEEWSKLSSLNNLSKVHQLYCGTEISKDERNIFVTGELSDISANFQDLMTYCSNDTVATYNILCKLFPLFLSRFPHPVTLAGMLELGLTYLPINTNWERYINDSNQTYEDLNYEAKLLLSQHADQACQLLHNDEYKSNLWLWDQDWSVKSLKLKKPVKKTKAELTEYELDENKTRVCDEVKSKKTDQDNLYSSSYDDYEQEYHKYLANKFKYLMDMENLLPVKTPHLPGYPAWYRKLCNKPNTPDWVPGPELISTSMQITPKLLSLTWKSLPLHFVRGQGWGQLVPFKTQIDIESDKLVPLRQLSAYYVSNCNIHDVSDGSTDKDKFKIHEEVETNLVKSVCDKHSKVKWIIMKNKEKSKTDIPKGEIGENCGFIKLPHKDGDHLNVGNPLARDYVNKFSENGLASSDSRAEKIIEMSRMLSYWRNNRERIESQMVVWLGKRDISRSLLTEKEVGVILPQVVVSGTLTRRAVEPTWMTASNAQDERIGSELRAMVQAPAGYNLVGADVDSQELWIASVIGDAYSNREHGGTPFGWMTLSGQKSEGTDMHSVTAKAVGISRHHAKIINYARIYGAGQQFAERLLKQFNPEMSSTEAKQKAMKMFAMTKGKRSYKLKEDVLPDIKQRSYNKFGVHQICSVHGKSIEDLFEKPKWVGGSESAMFNRLEEIASDCEPKTPFLKGRLSRALEPQSDKDDRFIPTKINWVVQSGAVDFLHLMLVCMRWLLGPQIRFCLSFHDEVRYLVPQEYRYQAALALHVTNLFTRAFCIHQLGMRDVPRSIAFFSSVEIDTVLRKEADHDCKTPSNPHGLLKGYGIPAGESLNIDQAIEKAKGVIGLSLYRTKSKNRSTQ